MIRATGRSQKQSVELDAPLSLSEGTVVEVVVRVKADPSTIERDEFADLGMARLEEAMGQSRRRDLRRLEAALWRMNRVTSSSCRFPYRDQLAESVRPAVIISRIDLNQRSLVNFSAVCDRKNKDAT